MLLPPHLSKVPGPVLDGIETWFGAWQVSPARPAPHQVPPQPGHSVGGRRRLPGAIGELRARRGTVRNRRVSRRAQCGARGHPAQHWRRSPRRAPQTLRSARARVGVSWPLRPSLRPRWHRRQRAFTDGTGANTPYPEQMLDDAREAIALVRKEAPGRQVILAGLCSGGWLAFQAARHGSRR